MVLDQLAPMTQTLEKLAEEGSTLFDHAVNRASTAPSSWGTNPLNSSLAYFIVEGTCSLTIIECHKSENTHFFFAPVTAFVLPLYLDPLSSAASVEDCGHEPNFIAASSQNALWLQILDDWPFVPTFCLNHRT